MNIVRVSWLLKNFKTPFFNRYWKFRPWGCSYRSGTSPFFFLFNIFKILKKHSCFSSCFQTMCYTFSIQKIARFDISCLWTTKDNPSLRHHLKTCFFWSTFPSTFSSLFCYMWQKKLRTQDQAGEKIKQTFFALDRHSIKGTFCYCGSQPK